MAPLRVTNGEKAKKGGFNGTAVGKAAETPAEDAPAEEEELEGPWVSGVASMGEARDALVTTAHRQLVRARDAAVSDYLAFYESSNADMLAHYDALVAEEESWHGTWEGLVKRLLVKSS